MNALIVLTARFLSLERNSRVFDNFATLAHEVCRKVQVEWELWIKAQLCGPWRDVT